MIRASISSVSHLIDDLYQAAYEPDHWTIALESLRVLFDGSRSCIRYDHGMKPGTHVANYDDPNLVLDFFRGGYPMDTVTSIISAFQVGVPKTDSGLVAKELLHKTQMWNDLMKPRDMYGGMATKILVSGELNVFVDIQRGLKQPEFSTEDLELKRALVPTLIRVAQISERLGHRNLSSRSAHMALDALSIGFVTVTPSMRVIEFNGAAEKIFERGNLSCQHGHLFTGNLALTRRLNKLVAEACYDDDGLPGHGGELVINSVMTDTPAVALSVAPVQKRHALSEGIPGPAAVIYIREIGNGFAADMQTRLRELFGLSARESEIAKGLVTGSSLQEIANASEISIATARTQLASIFRKTDTNRQSQLVMLLMQVLQLPRP
ncbi:helix-turn-helix transcriptional regulator [Mesorhizobium sp. SB112]|uniref:helix-turn-helix transcriptional regulator n=1 Tax=Mesorhizobium sp. SB112 TaxID=3151853 RepID=UPI0032643BCF